VKHEKNGAKKMHQMMPRASNDAHGRIDTRAGVLPATRPLRFPIVSRSLDALISGPVRGRRGRFGTIYFATVGVREFSENGCRLGYELGCRRRGLRWTIPGEKRETAGLPSLQPPAPGFHIESEAFSQRHGATSYRPLRLTTESHQERTPPPLARRRQRHQALRSRRSPVRSVPREQFLTASGAALQRCWTEN